MTETVETVTVSEARQGQRRMILVGALLVMFGALGFVSFGSLDGGFPVITKLETSSPFVMDFNLNGCLCELHLPIVPQSYSYSCKFGFTLQYDGFIYPDVGTIL